MSRREIEKLLGGYATGTLTDAERDLLFQAALEDQEIFNALLHEEPLRETLADPAARARLLATLDEPAPAWHERVMRWMWGHAVGVAAVGCFLAAGGYVAWQARHSAPPKTVLVAEMKPFSIDVTDEEPKPAKATRPFDTSSIVKPEPRKPKMPPLPAPPPIPAAKPVGGLTEIARPYSSLQSLGSLPQGATGRASSNVPVPAPPPIPAAETIHGLSEMARGYSSSQSFSFLPQDATGSPSSNVADVVAVEATAQPQGPGPVSYDGPPPGRPASVQVVAGRATFSAPQNESARASALAGALALAAVRSGIRFTVLRKAASGDFEPAEGTEFAAGDTVRLRITANETGYVTVLPEGAQQPLLATRVAQLSTVVTPDIQSAVAGSLRVQIAFTRASTALSAAPALRTADMSAPEAEGDRKDHAKSEAATDTPAAPLTYSITLRWR